MFNKEFELYEPVKAWLEAAGYCITPELPMPLSGGHPIDIVGWRHDRQFVATVELKMGFTKKAIYQAYMNKLVTPFSYIASPTSISFRKLDETAQYGLGILQVEPDAIRVIRKPKVSWRMLNWYMKPMRNRAIEQYEAHKHLVGGHPVLKGDGPRIDCAKLVVAYRCNNPGATWKQIWKAVPNHYTSPGSMGSSMAGIDDGPLRRAACNRL